jgi:D-alanyl-D-alanine carboxypeptidase/D-alanyl-D-alanine-endopeptidase (penicillin-binding protein 4)
VRNAISSLYVTDENGNVIFEKNAGVGLAPASTQKIITAATAYEILGKNYRYKTYIGYDIGMKEHQITGNLYVEGNGDPTLGSFRWKSTKDTQVLEKIAGILKNKSINRIRGDLWIDDLKFGVNPDPGGWIWEDMGNYYGAGSWGLNWRENQYDLVFQPSKYENEYARLLRTSPYVYDFILNSIVRTGAPGSGDNGYVYTVPYSKEGFVTGTIPQGKTEFTISGSLPQPAKQLGMELIAYLKYRNIGINGKLKLYSDSILKKNGVRKAMLELDSIVSPSMDSMMYYFLQKSINLYGETFLKTFALERFHDGNTEKAIEILQDFWKARGIETTELNLADGSGLSPLNRVTTRSQVKVLLYASKQNWFTGYFDAIPVYNGMKMKSGTINGVKGFCGYQTSKNGKKYVFSFLVNNYNGSSTSIVNKMYRVLDVLK